MADQRNDDDQTERQRQAGRRGEIIPGKGFDAGTGYGGAGNDSAYDAESSYGGQSGVGGDTLRGAYAGESYGRQGDDDPAPGSLDAGEGAGEGADDAERHGAGSAERDPTRDRGSAFDGREGGFDRDTPLGGERREPGR
jgi:hypothetical protein